jgi:hypothetical protein
LRSPNSTVISMRLPVASGKRLKRMANRHGWTASDASARLVEEGLRDSPAGRQACIQGSSLAVWEVMLLVGSYQGKVSSVASHLRWPQAKVQAAVNYASVFPGEIAKAIEENDDFDFDALKLMLPQAEMFSAHKKKRRVNAQTASR